MILSVISTHLWLWALGVKVVGLPVILFQERLRPPSSVVILSILLLKAFTE